MYNMKALVKEKPESGLWLKDVPTPKVGINDVLIKIYKTAICGTDVHIYNWNEWAQKTIPIPMLKVEYISSESIRPIRWSQPNRGGGCHLFVSMMALSPFGRSRPTFAWNPPPVTWTIP